jgi:hypothetical protein
MKTNDEDKDNQFGFFNKNSKKTIETSTVCFEKWTPWTSIPCSIPGFLAQVLVHLFVSSKSECTAGASFSALIWVPSTTASASDSDSDSAI